MFNMQLGIYFTIIYCLGHVFHELHYFNMEKYQWVSHFPSNSRSANEWLWLLVLKFHLGLFVFLYNLRLLLPRKNSQWVESIRERKKEEVPLSWIHKTWKCNTKLQKQYSLSKLAVNYWTKYNFGGKMGL